jgi:hypothetical protein
MPTIPKTTQTNPRPTAALAPPPGRPASAAIKPPSARGCVPVHCLVKGEVVLAVKVLNRNIRVAKPVSVRVA